MAPRPLTQRLLRIDWVGVERQLFERGWARLPMLLTAAECASAGRLWRDEALFRSRTVMSRHGYGEGEYRYFADPLPPLVAELRTGLYAQLAPIATRFRTALGDPSGFPAQLAEFLERCREHGQTKPTPLLLRYVEGGYNRLHQDLYGPVAFPLQVACFLSRCGEDYTGGDFVLVESRPRSQSRVESIATKRGDAVVFTTRERPECGARGGFRRVAVRHGVSTILSGERSTLGIIFHDAR
jgi:hypothetical protein